MALFADLPKVGADIATQLRQAGFPAEQQAIRQVLVLAEEAGECVGAFRRWNGMARRTGSFAELRAELADVLITAVTLAAILDIDVEQAVADKLEQVYARGWRDPRPGGVEGSGR